MYQGRDRRRCGGPLCRSSRIAGRRRGMFGRASPGQAEISGAAASLYGSTPVGSECGLNLAAPKSISIESRQRKRLGPMIGTAAASRRYYRSTPLRPPVRWQLTYGPLRLREFLRSCLFRSASTYPVSEQSSQPRWRSAQPGPHNEVGRVRAITCPRFPSCRSTVRPSRFHHSQTSSARQRLTPRYELSLTPRPANRQRQISPFAAAPPRRSAPICWPEPRQPHSGAPERASLWPSEVLRSARCGSAARAPWISCRMARNDEILANFAIYGM
jgi:hypothetical protein